MDYENYVMYQAPQLIVENWQKNWMITWQNVPLFEVSVHTLNQVIGVLEANGYTPLPPQERDVRSITKFHKQFYVRIAGRFCSLFWVETKRQGYDVYCRPHRITTNIPAATTDEVGEIESWEVKERIKKWFKGRNIEFDKIYLPITDSIEKQQIKHCIPSPINYAQGTKMIRLECYKADVSSAYAYESCKRLPTYEGRRIEKGIIAPTNEYPFAFYPHNGTLAILEEDGTIINTNDFYESAIYNEDYEKKNGMRRMVMNKRASWIKHNWEEQTILCKAVNDNTFSMLMNYLYRIRNTDKTAKPTMNIFLGTLQQNENPDRAYIAAVVLARCCYRMIRIAKHLEEDDECQVLLIATDSVAWKGAPHPEVWTKDKSLGAFVLEHYNVPMIILSPKKYQVQDKGCITKWAGVKKELTLDMKFGDILTNTVPEQEIFWSETLMRLVDADNNPY